VLPFRYAFHGSYLYGVKCSSCSLVFVHPQPTEEQIKDMYAEDYFTECSETCGAHGRSAYMEEATQADSSRPAHARRIDRLLRSHVSGGNTLMEIGCGPGFFLAEIRKLGWSVRGLEISKYAAAHAREELDLDVVVGPIEEDTIPAQSFDVVFMGDVLEHLPAPRSSLVAIRTWLKPGGIVVIAIPSTLNLLSAQLGMMLYRARARSKTLRIPPYHLFEYIPRTLRGMLEASGFEVVRLRQSAVPLRKMGLRGTLLENAGKVSLQVFAHLTSGLLNRGGDRLLAIGRKT
jgi:SAM-dependent methyltransferase